MSETFVDARLGLDAVVVGNVVVSITCSETFFVRGHPDDLIGAELWELEAVTGHRFEPDERADELIFEVEAIGLACVVWDGRVSIVWLSDWDLIDEDAPTVPRPVGAG